MEEHVVLGRMWCYLTNYQIDWHNQQAKVVYKRHVTQVPLLQDGTSMQSSMQNSGDSTIGKDKGKNALPQDTLSTKTSFKKRRPNSLVANWRHSHPLGQSVDEEGREIALLLVRVFLL